MYTSTTDTITAGDSTSDSSGVTASDTGVVPNDIATFSADTGTDDGATPTDSGTDLGSTSMDVSTSYPPVPTPSPITANASSLAQNDTGSNQYVIAQVISSDQNPSIAANTTSPFLLVTFGTTNPSSSASATPGSNRRRQASQQPLVYNATQSFPVTAGAIYNLSASATDAQNGDSPSNCALTICANSMCGSPNPLTTDFVQYTYTYNAPSSGIQIGTFSI